jgi:hypothetical protein
MSSPPGRDLTGGRREEMYYCREKGSNNYWSEEDRAILRDHYPTSPRQTIMELLPNRGWASIRGEAIKSGIKRKVYNEPGDSQKFSHNDLLFMRGKELALEVESTRWEPGYQLVE